MTSAYVGAQLAALLRIAAGIAASLGLTMTALSGAPPTPQAGPAGTSAATTQGRAASPARGKSFDTPRHAADAVIRAAERYDVAEFKALFGPELDDVIGADPARGHERAREFVAEARMHSSVFIDRRTGTRAVLLVGHDNWPFPFPIVKHGARWSFDAKAGRHELLARWIGSNELDAIKICHGYVEAQHDYALLRHDGHEVNEYAQRIISSPGTRDGLAWQKADGTWDGPVGVAIAQAIAQGSSSRSEPYHGYFFKVLKGQGPAAPLGEMDFVVKGMMIGGFALVASPARYRVTGVKTFIVSHDGVVYQKDLGAGTLDQFTRMDRFNPDKTWTPVVED